MAHGGGRRVHYFLALPLSPRTGQAARMILLTTSYSRWLSRSRHTSPAFRRGPKC